jgi:hypothetical protein
MSHAQLVPNRHVRAEVRDEPGVLERRRELQIGWHGADLLGVQNSKQSTLSALRPFTSEFNGLVLDQLGLGPCC